MIFLHAVVFSTHKAQYRHILADPHYKHTHTPMTPTHTLTAEKGASPLHSEKQQGLSGQGAPNISYVLFNHRSKQLKNIGVKSAALQSSCGERKVCEGWWCEVVWRMVVVVCELVWGVVVCDEEWWCVRDGGMWGGMRDGDVLRHSCRPTSRNDQNASMWSPRTSGHS